MKNKIVDLKKRLSENMIDEGRKILAGLQPHEIRAITEYLVNRFVIDIENGLKGEIEYKDSAFFEIIDRLYREGDPETQPQGCYFCDSSIDGNSTPFDYPDKTKLCLSCQLKVANLLVAFNINHNCLFPGMGERKIQEVIYQEYQEIEIGSEIKH